MIGMARSWTRLGAGALAIALAVSWSQAQQGPPGSGPRPSQAPGAREAPPADAGGGGLQKRIEQLEEQIIDLQVVTGTLESLAKGGVAPRGKRRR